MCQCDMISVQSNVMECVSNASNVAVVLDYLSITRSYDGVQNKTNHRFSRKPISAISGRTIRDGIFTLALIKKPVINQRSVRDMPETSRTAATVQQQYTAKQSLKKGSSSIPIPTIWTSECETRNGQTAGKCKRETCPTPYHQRAIHQRHVSCCRHSWTFEFETMVDQPCLIRDTVLAHGAERVGSVSPCSRHDASMRRYPVPRSRYCTLSAESKCI